MARITNNTWMQVDYPLGKTSIGYVSQSGERQLISMSGAQYRVKDLLESGYTFSPLVAMTEERIEALETLLDNGVPLDSLDKWQYEAYHNAVRALRAMLNELEDSE